MAMHNNPRIIHDGLIMYLDAANVKSYPGSGTVWTDMIQNVVFNSNGTQTPFTVLNNIPCFAFNGSGYWETSTQDSLKVDLRFSFTIILWYYKETLAVRKTLFEKRGTIHNSYEQEIAITTEAVGNFSYFRGFSSAYDAGVAANGTLSSWNMCAIKCMGTDSTNRSGQYSVNGAPWITNYVRSSNDSIVQAAGIRIGYGYAGIMTNGYISNVLIYNNELSYAQLQQNYNAMHSKYGL